METQRNYCSSDVVPRTVKRSDVVLQEVGNCDEMKLSSGSETGVGSPCERPSSASSRKLFRVNCRRRPQALPAYAPAPVYMDRAVRLQAIAFQCSLRDPADRTGPWLGWKLTTSQWSWTSSDEVAVVPKRNGLFGLNKGSFVCVTSSVRRVCVSLLANFRLHDIPLMVVVHSAGGPARACRDGGRPNNISVGLIQFITTSLAAVSGLVRCEEKKIPPAIRAHRRFHGSSSRPEFFGIDSCFPLVEDQSRRDITERAEIPIKYVFVSESRVDVRITR